MTSANERVVAANDQPATIGVPNASEAVAEVEAGPADKNEGRSPAIKPHDTGQVLEFNGFDSYVDVGHIPFDLQDAFTIEVWVKGWHQMIVYQGKEGDPENSVWLGWGDIGWINGWEANGGENFVHKIDGKVSEDWEHLALVCDGKHQYFFVDGKQVHKIPAPKPGEMIRNRPLLVGAQQTWKRGQTGDTQRHGSGLLAALRISSKALYTKPFTPPSTFKSGEETELLYDMSRKDDNTLFDISSKKRDGKVHNVNWVPRAEADRG